MNTCTSVGQQKQTAGLWLPLSCLGAGKMVKVVAQFAFVLLLASAAWAQQSRIYREGGAWVQEITGSLPAARSLQVSAQSASVEVQGGSQQAVTYTVRERVYTGSEQAARRQLQQYRFSASDQAGTAVLEGQTIG